MNDALIPELEKALKCHDWYYQQSDNYQSWKRGNDNFQNIKLILCEVNEEKAYELYKKYAPANFIFPKVKK